jgi:hypothetical protein
VHVRLDVFAFRSLDASRLASAWCYDRVSC